VKTQRKGVSGLSLSISKAIVETFGGKIGVECPTEGGSLFYIELIRPIQEPVGRKIDLLRWWESGTYFPDFSLRRMTMRLNIVKICSRSPTLLAAIT
jgi:hypothetical protein